MAKMFVHYNGTVADFKAANLESKYNNHIVFIKGGANGTGESVYTHGQYYGNVKDALAALENKVNGMAYFSKISDGTNTATTTEANGTITFSATDPSQVLVDVNTKGVKIGLSETFKTKVNDTAANLGTKDDAADVNGTAFARIANLKSIVSSITGGTTESIESQIKTAIENLDVDASTGDYVASISQVDGKIVAVPGTFNFDEAGAAANAEQNAKNYAEGLAKNYDAVGSAAAVASDLADHASDSDIHITAEERALWNEAKSNIDAFLKDAELDAEGKNVVDTLKELQSYMTTDGEAASELVGRVAALEAINHNAYIAADEANLAAAKTYTNETIAGLDLANTYDAKGAAAKALEDANAAVKALKEGEVKANADAIAAMTLAEVSGYVTKVSQANGKVSATTVANIPAADVTIADANDKLASTTVEAALAELADMWAWEEL